MLQSGGPSHQAPHPEGAQRGLERHNKEALPSIWHHWADCKKEEHHAVLQDHFCKMAQDLKMPGQVAMVELTNLLYMLAFAVLFRDKLENGMN
jgi:hypothetical protein